MANTYRRSSPEPRREASVPVRHKRIVVEPRKCASCGRGSNCHCAPMEEPEYSREEEEEKYWGM